MQARSTRAQRFRVLRNAIVAQQGKMRDREGVAMRELTCGPYLIHYASPGAWGTMRGSHIDIWPGSNLEDRAVGVSHGNKVCSVDWWQDDQINIVTYRSGAWEEELINLLEAWV